MRLTYSLSFISYNIFGKKSWNNWRRKFKGIIWQQKLLRKDAILRCILVSCQQPRRKKCCHDLRWERRNKSMIVTNAWGNVEEHAGQREGPFWGAIAYLLTTQQDLSMMYFSLNCACLFLTTNILINSHFLLSTPGLLLEINVLLRKLFPL